MVGATDTVGVDVWVGRGVDVTGRRVETAVTGKGNGVFSVVIIGFDSTVAVAGDDVLHAIEPDMIPIKTIRNQIILLLDKFTFPIEQTQINTTNRGQYSSYK